MKLSAVIKLILNRCDNKIICFFTNGFISRLAFAIKDRPENFYMIGSMGLISSLALGVALNSSKKVIVFDGDGSILMNLGAMPLVGYEKPNNFVHLVLDNKVYASTGNQPTISTNVNFCKIAGSVGYKNIFSFNRINNFKRKIDEIMKAKELTFVHLNIEPEASFRYPRVKMSPSELALRIKDTLNKY